LRSWRALCFNSYPGTREGVILVVETPPIELDLADAPTNSERRRDELADFLRTRRAALTPEDVGLPGGGRRRTPGLRREEVALLSGVGTTWYTWLEQGRDVRASQEVLEAIATALHMTRAERTHLLVLGRGEEPPFSPACAESVSPMLRRLIENLNPNPAYLLGRRWDYLAWNSAACALLGDLDGIPDHVRNHMWLTFTDPARRDLFSDWEESSRLMVAKFRADSARHIGDATWEELTQALRKSSPEFCKAWRRHEVAVQGGGRKVLNHPVAGRLCFDHAALNPQDTPDQRLILYTPLPEDGTAEKMAGLVEALSQNC
jgi:transcriptional regulator with XRE-family HTH domain